MPFAFFNGACQGTPGVCGARAIFHLKIVHHFSMKYWVGQGTKNMVELYVCWILLKIVVDN